MKKNPFDYFPYLGGVVARCHLERRGQATLEPADKEQMQLRETVDTCYGICLGDSLGKKMSAGEWRAGFREA